MYEDKMYEKLNNNETLLSNVAQYRIYIGQYLNN